MNELRVYINPSGASGRGTFYSRRSSGPVYCWFYEEQVGQWQADRVRLPDTALRAMRVMSWRSVPPELRAKMNEHYLE